MSQKSIPLFVTKRNNEKQEFNLTKLRDQINFACKDLDVNPIVLESRLQSGIRNNIKTSELQELLIHSTLHLITTDEPDWLHVAGRLSMYQLHREVYKNTKIQYSEFSNFLDYAIKNKYYRSDIKDKYSTEDILKFQKAIEDAQDSDFEMVLPQVLSLKSKYLVKTKKGIIEYPLFADMANAMLLADNPEMVLEYFKSLYTQSVSLATPFKANLRREGGNTGSCFILSVGDSLDQISKSWNDIAKISKEGGGVGVYLGKIRPSGTHTQNIPKSNNISRWVKIINDIAVAVNQRGVRKGAVTPALDWYHLDIDSFIRMKSELGGDLREKCFDIFPQVVVDQYFIDAVKYGREVFLFNHFEVKEKLNIDVTDLVDKELYDAHLLIDEAIKDGKIKGFEKIQAKTLWVEFLKIWIETGDFYIIHKDNINLSNYLKSKYIANSANLCVESFSLSKVSTDWTTKRENSILKTTSTDGLSHSCSLISLNLGVLLTDKKLQQACRSAVRMLDASIDSGTMPILEAEISSQYLRNIGIGTMGTADWMAWNKLSYEKPQDIDELEKLYEKIAFYCYNESIELAKEKGPYPGIVDADYSKLFGIDPVDLTKDSLNGFDWVDLQSRIKTFGIRNFLLLAIAPNTSSGILNYSTASYLPPHNKLNYQTLADMSVPIMPRYIKQRFWYYKGKFQYKAEDLLRVTGRIQKFIDTGISSEVFINPELTNIKNISDAIIEGFSNQTLKGIYYSLTIDAKKEYSCTDCAN